MRSNVLGKLIEVYYLVTYSCDQDQPVSIAEVSSRPMKATIGTGEIMGVVEECLRHSQLGERMQFKIFPKHPEFPWLFRLNGVQGGEEEIQRLRREEINAYFLLELEVCKITPSDSNSIPRGNSEKYNSSVSAKNRGDEFFRLNDHFNCQESYLNALALIPYDEGEVYLTLNNVRFDELKTKILMNLSFSYYKSKNYKESIQNAKKILYLYDSSIYKVHYRKAMAEYASGLFDDAILTWEMAKIYAATEEERFDCDKQIENTKNLAKTKEEKHRRTLAAGLFGNN